MGIRSYSKQIKIVLLFELIVVILVSSIAYFFWSTLCDDSLESCLGSGAVVTPVSFIILSIIRPFVFTPVLFVAMLGGKVFGPILGTLLTAVGSTISCLLIFWFTKMIGHRLAKPWLRSNLPATYKFIRSQDYKIVFALRLIPFVPFDFVSILCGALDFRTKKVIWASFFGVLPGAFLFAQLVDPSVGILQSTLTTLLGFAAVIIVNLVVYEFLSRKKGSGLWQTTKAMYREVTYEIRTNNEIVKRQTFDPNRTPVLLLYGFFSSRRSVTVLERMLNVHGFEVLSFNLGGLFGTFFTRDIIDTANFIDMKLKRQMERHGFNKIHIVAHSKGGLVALWWLLRLGGYKYCDKVVTMGTPFKGSLLTYLALLTPLGFFWRDVYQMRPGSSFLKSLWSCQIPESLHIYCLNSKKDRVTYSKSGVFAPVGSEQQVEDIPMDHIGHFEFLYRRDIGDVIAEILKGRDQADQKQSNNQQAASQ